MVQKLCLLCQKIFCSKSSLNRHTKTFHKPCVQASGETVPVGAFDTPSQGDMDDVEKILLADKDNKKVALNNDNLSDEQK